MTLKELNSETVGQMFEPDFDPVKSEQERTATFQERFAHSKRWEAVLTLWDYKPYYEEHEEPFKVFVIPDVIRIEDRPHAIVFIQVGGTKLNDIDVPREQLHTYALRNPETGDYTGPLVGVYHA